MKSYRDTLIWHQASHLNHDPAHKKGIQNNMSGYNRATFKNSSDPSLPPSLAASPWGPAVEKTKEHLLGWKAWITTGIFYGGQRATTSMSEDSWYSSSNKVWTSGQKLGDPKVISLLPKQTLQPPDINKVRLSQQKGYIPGQMNQGPQPNSPYHWWLE